ncbi:Plasmodium exported protein, unknown function [Plasmodium ovale curtisi]|uniref:Pv-fam-h protein n=1 Tax=Plasmodium ovale curtisi TaxID=864141 RepID=A0A1A8X1J1_PLAOA|nr:Plasmodium exported protein, unknown function [Plasmodium ovale curtisi]
MEKLKNKDTKQKKASISHFLKTSVCAFLIWIIHCAGNGKNNADNTWGTTACRNGRILTEPKIEFDAIFDTFKNSFLDQVGLQDQEKDQIKDLMKSYFNNIDFGALEEQIKQNPSLCSQFPPPPCVLEQLKIPPNLLEQMPACPNTFPQLPGCPNMFPPFPAFPNIFPQSQPSTSSNEEPQPSTSSHDDAQPSTSSYDNGQPSTSSYDNAQPSTSFYDNAQPSTSSYDNAQPSTSSNEEPQPSTSSHEEPQPSTSSHDDAQPSTSTYDNAQPSTSSFDDAQPSTSSYDDAQPSTSSYDNAQPSTSTFGQPQPNIGCFGSPQGCPNLFGALPPLPNLFAQFPPNFNIFEALQQNAHIFEEIQKNAALLQGNLGQPQPNPIANEQEGKEKVKITEEGKNEKNEDGDTKKGSTGTVPYVVEENVADANSGEEKNELIDDVVENKTKAMEGEEDDENDVFVDAVEDINEISGNNVVGKKGKKKEAKAEKVEDVHLKASTGEKKIGKKDAVSGKKKSPQNSITATISNVYRKLDFFGINARFAVNAAGLIALAYFKLKLTEIVFQIRSAFNFSVYNSKLWSEAIAELVDTPPPWYLFFFMSFLNLN